MIWLTGRNGTLGTEVERCLHDANTEYIATGSEYSITRKSNITKLFKTHRPSTVINCAAYTNVDKAEEQKKLAYAVNAGGPQLLAAACKKHGALLIHISTDYVFGEECKVYYPSDTPNPLNEYGRSKALGEKYITSSRCKHIIIRTAWLYGHTGRSFVSSITKGWQYAALAPGGFSRSISVVDDQFGSPTYAADLANAIMHMIVTPRHGIYHYTNTGYTSRYKLAVAIAHQLRRFYPLAPPVIITQRKTDDTVCRRPKHAFLSKSKTKRVFGFHMSHWENALTRYFNREYANKGICNENA